MMMLNLLYFGLLCSILSYTTVYAEDRIKLDETTVIGNQDLPRVTYILPWQLSSMPNLADPPLAQLINEALAPVDREVFRRQLHYYRVFSTTDTPQETPGKPTE